MMESIGRLGMQGVSPIGEGAGVRVGGLRPNGEGVSFGDVLKQALGEVSKLQEEAQDAIAAFVRGEPVELHQVMAATEEAGIALDMLIEIRNKLTEAYRTVISMQA